MSTLVQFIFDGFQTSSSQISIYIMYRSFFLHLNLNIQKIKSIENYLYQVLIFWVIQKSCISNYVFSSNFIFLFFLLIIKIPRLHLPLLDLSDKSFHDLSLFMGKYCLLRSRVCSEGRQLMRVEMGSLYVSVNNPCQLCKSAISAKLFSIEGWLKLKMGPVIFPKILVR